MNGSPHRLLILSAALLGCAEPGGAQSDPVPWPKGRLVEARLLGRTVDRRLAEASGAAASRANPGIIWTVADGGNPAELYGIDTTGTIRMAIPVPVPNVDWEEVAVGPCGEGTCIYIADTGDNTGRRQEVSIHRFAEPVLGSENPLQVESLTFRYPTGREDVEAMAVLPDGEILLASKGRSGRIRLFSLPARSWDERQPATAGLVRVLPIEPAMGSGRAVTGMAIDPAGTKVAIRTYRDIFMLSRGRDGRLEPVALCDVLGREPQGEGITFDRDGSLITTSERGFFPSGTIHRMRCEAAPDNR